MRGLGVKMVGIVAMVVVEVKITVVVDSWMRGLRLGVALVPRLDRSLFKILSSSSFVFGYPVGQW